MASARPKVLLADACDASRAAVEPLLDRMGLEVFTARDGGQARELIVRLSPRLAMLDTRLPPSGGVGLLEELRRDRVLAKIPILMLASDPSPALRARCLDLGCLDYLARPIDLLTLHAAIERHLAVSHEHRRRQLRVSYRSHVEIRHDVTTNRCYAMTLSQGGIYVSDRHPLPVGTRVTVAVPLGAAGEVEVEGEVIYNRIPDRGTSPLPPGMAIRFTDVSDRASRAITTFLSDSLMATTREIVIDVPEAHPPSPPEA